MNRLLPWAAGALLVAAGCIPAAAQDAGAAAGDSGWTSYADDYGTMFDFPAGIFSVAEGAPPIGNGRRFRTADGRAELNAYTLDNAEHESARAYLARHLRSEFKNLDYHRVSDRFFAVSGIVRGKTFYSRCNYESPRGPMHCIYLAYPSAENHAWDSVVTRISRSLRTAGSSASR
jgi:hypothetical protein